MFNPRLRLIFSRFKGPFASPMSMLKHLSLAVMIVAALAPNAQGEPAWELTVFGGQMTDNVWEEAILPGQTELVDSYLIGCGVARDFAAWRAFDFGIEGQAVAHFGAQDHLEFNVPFYARYSTPEGWRIFKSFTFGLGLSYATKVPQTEIDRDGQSTREMFYWMGEIEFHLPSDDYTMVFRLHHRSDGYGVFEENSGSNALVLGLRRKF